MCGTGRWPPRGHRPPGAAGSVCARHRASAAADGRAYLARLRTEAWPASTAMYLGHRYSVVTTLDRTVPLIEDRLLVAGLLSRCASVRASGLSVLELEEDTERTVETIVDEWVRAVRDDHAEVIWLGWGGMAGLAERVNEATGVPVVDVVAAAVTVAESLVRLGLRTSKVRTYAPPRAKRLSRPLAAQHRR